MTPTFTKTALATLFAAGFLAASPAQADYASDGGYAGQEVNYSTLLSGNLTNNAWRDLSVTGAGFSTGFPGTAPWPNPISSQANTSAGTGSSTVGGASLNKVANGTGGGPYPASGGIYYGGFSGDVNNDGGKLAVTDATPLANLQTVVFQVGIGEAWTYDFKDHTLPTLSLTYAGGTVSGLTANFHELLSAYDNGTVTMPTGEETVYINQHALQWDLSAYSGITQFDISFNGVQHAQLYGLTLTQSDQFSQVVSAVPETSTYAMLMAGLGVIGGVARRRRKLDA